MNSRVLRNRDEYKKRIVLEELCRDSQLVKAGKSWMKSRRILYSWFIEQTLSSSSKDLRKAQISSRIPISGLTPFLQNLWIKGRSLRGCLISTTFELYFLYWVRPLKIEKYSPLPANSLITKYALLHSVGDVEFLGVTVCTLAGLLLGSQFITHSPNCCWEVNLLHILLIAGGMIFLSIFGSLIPQRLQINSPDILFVFWTN